MSQLEIPDPPKVGSDGCYDIDEVIDFVNIVGEEPAARKLKVSLHRIVFFKSKLKESKRVNTSIHSLR